MPYFMGIDLGTQSLKALLVNENGDVLAQACRAYGLREVPLAENSADGFCEQDGGVWWGCCVEAVREISAGLSGPVEGVSFSGQMHGAVLLGKNYELLRPVIIHCDTRSKKQTLELKQIMERRGFNTAKYNPVYTGFLLPSLMWVKENEPSVYEKIKFVCLPKDYLKLKMTGIFSSDYSDASGTLAFDVSYFEWDKELLRALEIDPAVFPPCAGSCEESGRVCAAAAEETGLAAGVIAGQGGGDQIMQAAGCGAVRPGQATVNVGSSGQVCFQAGVAAQGGGFALNTFCGAAKGSWITMGATMSAGLSAAWFVKNAGFEDYFEFDAAAREASAGCGGVLFMPYLLGERAPYLNPALRGAFLGLSLGTERGAMARSVMEGVAFSLRQCAGICSELGLCAKEFTASGGGAGSALWLSILASVLGAPLKTVKCSEQAALGAAVSAAAASGFYGSIAEAAGQMVKYKSGVTEPDAQNQKIYDESYERFVEAGKLIQRVAS